MAKLEKLIPLIEKWEGGYVNDPDDKGGPTNMGVTLKTWQKCGYDKNGDGVIDKQDLRLVTRDEMIQVILKPHYWDVWQADKIRNQSVANLLVDWLWCSGPRTIVIIQHLLDLKTDGIVGKKTLRAINSYPNQEKLHLQIKTARIYFIDKLCEIEAKNNKFKRGWKNRISDFSYTPLLLLFLLLGLLSPGCRSASVATQEIAAESVATSENRGESIQLTGYKDEMRQESTHEREIETVVVLFSLPANVAAEAVVETIPPFATGIARIQRVKESVKVIEGSAQQTAAVQNQQSSTETHQSHKNQSAKTAGQSSERPNKSLSILIVFAVLITGFALFVNTIKR